MTGGNERLAMKRMSDRQASAKGPLPRPPPEYRGRE